MTRLWTLLLPLEPCKSHTHTHTLTALNGGAAGGQALVTYTDLGAGAPGLDS